MMFQRALLAGLVLMLGACSSIKSGPPPTPLTDFTATAKFSVTWQAKIGDAGRYVLQPEVDKVRVVAVSQKGQLIALDRNTGKILWKTEVGMTVSGGVGGDETISLVGGDKGDVWAYDASGKLLWQTKVSSEVLGVPKYADGVVVVRTGDSHITGLDAKDGKRLWSYERATPALVVRSAASVTILRGTVYAGFAAGKIVALELKTGSMLWENAVSQPRGNTELDRISDITSNVVVDDEQACAIAFQGRVACFDPAQGGPLWNRDIASDKGMMLLRKYLYLADANGVVMALDKSNGSTLWKNEQLSLRNTSQPYAYSNYVVVGDYEGYLHALDREDGHFVARTKLDGSPLLGSPLEFDDGMLVQTRDGNLYALKLN